MTSTVAIVLSVTIPLFFVIALALVVVYVRRRRSAPSSTQAARSSPPRSKTPYPSHNLYVLIHSFLPFAEYPEKTDESLQ